MLNKTTNSNKWQEINEKSKTLGALDLAKPTSEVVREKPRRSLAALDLAGRTTSEEARVKVSRSLAALDLAISKVQEAKMSQTSFTADPLVRKTNERTVAAGDKARKAFKPAWEALQPAREEAIDSKRFEKTPTHAPSAPTKAPTPSSSPIPTFKH